MIKKLCLFLVLLMTAGCVSEQPMPQQVLVERPVVNNSRLFEQIAQKLGTFNPMSGTKSILETQAEFNRILSNSGADQLAEILGLPSTIISKVADKLNMPSDVLASNAKKVMDEIDLCV